MGVGMGAGVDTRVAAGDAGAGAGVGTRSQHLRSVGSVGGVRRAGLLGDLLPDP